MSLCFKVEKEETEEDKQSSKDYHNDYEEDFEVWSSLVLLLHTWLSTEYI